jgi:PKD repeat protein
VSRRAVREPVRRGDTGSGAKPHHQYAAEGIYSVTLTVTDASGQSDSVTREIKVN